MSGEVPRESARALRAVLSGRGLTAVLQEMRVRRRRWSPRDLAAVQDIAYGTLRWLARLRAMLATLCVRTIPAPDLEALLLCALYRLEFTPAPPYAVVDSTVRASAALASPRVKPFVNAVLRTFLRQRSALRAHAQRTEEGRFCYPQWWIDLVRDGFPEQFAEVLDAGNLHFPMTLRVNRRVCDPVAYCEYLASAGMRGETIGECAVALERPVSVEALPGFRDGWVSVQDLAAQHAAGLLDAQDGERVLDACAAPGGKTAHVLERSAVELLALDRDAVRIERLRENLARLRLSARTQLADAGDLSAWWDGCDFDRVLLDAPCTGSGVVKRHPDIKWLRRGTDVGQAVQEQRRLLDALWRTLKPGGTLLYVTCSVFTPENQAQIAGFLAAHDDAQLAPSTRPGQPDGQLLPDARQDGFFYARLVKAA
jgi:16S rRNA (cytosine967-C5)-methyltransferase